MLILKKLEYLTDLKHDQEGFVKEISKDGIYLFSSRLRDYIYCPGDYIYNPAYLCINSQSVHYPLFPPGLY